MEKNREMARINRERHKVYVQGLEQAKARMGQEAVAMRARMTLAEAENATLRQELARMREQHVYYY